MGCCSTKPKPVKLHDSPKLTRKFTRTAMPDDSLMNELIEIGTIEIDKEGLIKFE